MMEAETVVQDTATRGITDEEMDRSIAGVDNYWTVRALVRGVMELAGAMCGGQTVAGRTDPLLYNDIKRLAQVAAERAGEGDLTEALRAVAWQAERVYDAIQEVGDEDEIPAGSILAIDGLADAAWKLVANTDVADQWGAQAARRRDAKEQTGATEVHDA